VVVGADVLIIGAGIIGCATARELARRGARVRVFEARTVAAGATHASAGILAPYIEAHERGPLFDLTIRSLALYDDWIAEVCTDAAVDVEYERCGTLELAPDATSADHLRALADSNHLEWLDGNTVRAIERLVPQSIVGALRAKEHGYVAVSALTEALAWASLRLGVEVETRRRITSVVPDADRVRVTADDGVSWDARWVVVAAGSWTRDIGLREPAGTHVRPVRGQLLRLKWEARPFTHILWGPACYLVPWRDGTVLVGATVEDVGFDERTTAAGVRDLLDAACELVPETWRATFLDARVGLRPATSDGLPIIGPSEIDQKIVYATGHFRNGVLLAPITARIVSDYVLEDRRDPALPLLRPGRFTAVP
jgi:glycine oxidase